MQTSSRGAAMVHARCGVQAMPQAARCRRRRRSCCCCCVANPPTPAARRLGPAHPLAQALWPSTTRSRAAPWSSCLPTWRTPGRTTSSTTVSPCPSSPTGAFLEHQLPALRCCWSTGGCKGHSINNGVSLPFLTDRCAVLPSLECCCCWSTGGAKVTLPFLTDRCVFLGVLRLLLL